MIDILKQENNVITYKCSCGAKGMCTFKPPNRDGAMVIILKCVACSEAESITLLQCGFNKNISNVDLLWVPFVNEELLQDEEDN